MTALSWDALGERFYETGVDHGVLYLPDEDGVYATGYVWNGLTAVTESPSGAEATPQYADNIKYLNLVSAEEFSATIEAFTYPDEFGECDGSAAPATGVLLGQQKRKMFGLSYRTRLGNDVDGTDLGYKIHLIYGAQAAPTEKAYSTVNDSPEPITFSWEITTTPMEVTNYKPTSVITVDSTKVDADALAELEELLYGSQAVVPGLPTPNEVLALFPVGTLVAPTVPTFVTSTGVLTVPSKAGVVYLVDDVPVSSGAQAAILAGVTIEVTAAADTGYYFAAGTTASWTFTRSL